MPLFRLDLPKPAAWPPPRDPATVAEALAYARRRDPIGDWAHTILALMYLAAMPLGSGMMTSQAVQSGVSVFSSSSSYAPPYSAAWDRDIAESDAADRSVPMKRMISRSSFLLIFTSFQRRATNVTLCLKISRSKDNSAGFTHS